MALYLQVQYRGYREKKNNERGVYTRVEAGEDKKKLILKCLLKKMGRLGISRELSLRLPWWNGRIYTFRPSRKKKKGGPSLIKGESEYTTFLGSP